MDRKTLDITRRIRSELPGHFFNACPSRLIIVLALGAGIVALNVLMLRPECPRYGQLAASLLCGWLYASLFFLGHEAGHGSIARSRLGQDALMTVAFAIFLLSPALWRVWHNQVHHGHANDPDYDPDNFGTIQSYDASWPVRLVHAMTPGDGRWATLFAVPIWFTAHSQAVLWAHSSTCKGFEQLNRRRAMLQTLAVVAAWAALGIGIGAVASFYVIALPMLVANTVIMSYIPTNHLLRSLCDSPDALASSMSVRTHPWLDLIHFNFSHHVEHHMFPAMNSRHVPHVRRKLEEHVGEHFLAPPHWLALLTVFLAPRVHDGPRILVTPGTGTRIEVEAIAEALRCRQVLPALAKRPTSTNC
jgi:fatty acid desaturase